MLSASCLNILCFLGGRKLPQWVLVSLMGSFLLKGELNAKCVQSVAQAAPTWPAIRGKKKNHTFLDRVIGTSAGPCHEAGSF